MNSIFLNINWLVVIPLGFTSLFFLWMGSRRVIRFVDHNNNASQKERLRDIFLFVFDLGSMAFCFLLAISPTNMWLQMIPIGLAVLIFSISISIAGSYYQLYVVTGYMPKNSGIKTSPGVRVPNAKIQNYSSFPSTHFSIPNTPTLHEEFDGKVAWYEFTPFVFMAGWLIYFLFNIAILAIG